ncbi:hypothetical protein MP228_010613 [Amoeboaphelidium protococcarum]|nr:hypothetical protein MP228_010613 [Amoeboaphelidium protococcarum]
MGKFKSIERKLDNQSGVDQQQNEEQPANGVDYAGEFEGFYYDYALRQYFPISSQQMLANVVDSQAYSVNEQTAGQSSSSMNKLSVNIPNLDVVVVKSSQADETVNYRTNNNQGDRNQEGKTTKDKKETSSSVLRAAAGEVWKDDTLMEWPKGFRLFVGSLSRDCKDADLQRAFMKYKSMNKVRVVMDKSGLSKGYGFVSFAEMNDFVDAFREMNGKLVNGRPIVLRKSNFQERSVTKTQAKKLVKREGYKQNI